jgi:hypothetical protein
MTKDVLKYLQPNAVIPIDMETTTALVNALKEALAQRTEQEPVMVLPDGGAFGVMSFPLPDDHWLYAPNEYRDGEHEPIDLPKPVLTRPFRDAVVAAVRYAVRGATMRGQETDFDPDALVQNAVYALCGPYTTPPARPPQRTEQEPTCPECKAVVLYECVACSSNNYPPPQRTEQEPCVHAKNPKGCYRVRCQVGDKCVDDEMSFRTTPPQPEPVAHLWECLGRWSAYLANNGTQTECAPPSWLVEAVKNATAPPQRTWVGLTLEQYIAINSSCTTVDQAVGSTERQLKENNT